jgi:hypothetical protein
MKKYTLIVFFALIANAALTAPTCVATFGALDAALRAMQTTGGEIELAYNITITPGAGSTYTIASTDKPIFINTAGYTITVKGTGKAQDAATLIIGNNVTIYGIGNSIKNDSQGIIRITGGTVQLGPLSSKRGLGLSTNNLNINDWVAAVINLKPHWFYTWGNTDRSTLITGAEFVPQIWGKANATKTACDNINAAYRAGRVKYVLGFNEPDLAAESNISVDTALKYWKFLCDNLDPGIQLVSPTPSYPTRQWLYDFMDSCAKRNLRVDHIAVHVYPAAPGAANYETTIREVYNKYQKPIWVTEFALRDESANATTPNRYNMQTQVLPFMKNAVSKYEEMPEVFRYAWFTSTSATMYGLSSAMLTNPDLTLTILGEYYKTVSTNNAIKTP